MRMPNKNILDSLYSSLTVSYDFRYIYSVYDTARYKYLLFLNLPYSGHDVIQRQSIRHPEDFCQIGYDRPSCYNDLSFDI